MAKKPTDRGAVKEQYDDLVTKRKVRSRQPGDGKGEDISLGVVGKDLEKILLALPKTTRQRMLEHIRRHVDEAMKPLLRAVERAGNEYQLHYLKDVGPNMMRTIMEFLEDESKK